MRHMQRAHGEEDEDEEEEMCWIILNIIEIEVGAFVIKDG